MQQPPGFVDKDRPDYVCKLKKPIYGLKQAPRSWYNELKWFLLDSGFHNSLADASLFFHNQGVTMYLLVYVDDIIITRSSPTAVRDFIDLISKRFALKDLGDLSYFLGIEVTRSSSGVVLSQRKYFSDLLHLTRMAGAKPTATPLCSTLPLTLEDGTPLYDNSEYKTVVGGLKYMSLTRPDISFAVSKLSQFMHKPTTTHWKAVKRVLCYLAGTITTGFVFKRSNSLSLHAYSDADWTGNRDDYTSTGAYIVFIGQHHVLWSAKKQTSVVRSSTETEYRYVANISAEVHWVASLLFEIGIPPPVTPVIYCDNIGPFTLLPTQSFTIFIYMLFHLELNNFKTK